MSPHVPADGSRSYRVSINDFDRQKAPYRVPLVQILFLKGGFKLWRMQVAHTKKHLQMERAGGIRLVNLTDGHFIGHRPWCSTELFACPNGRRACCPCLHGETPERAMA